MSKLKQALEAAKIKIAKYDSSKQRPVSTNIGTMDIRKFSGSLLERLGAEILKFPEIVEAAHDQGKMEDLLAEMFPQEEEEDNSAAIQEEYGNLTLNLDIAVSSKEDKFFLTTPDEFISEKNGDTYLKVCGIPDPVAYQSARKVIKNYRPRGSRGVSVEIGKQAGETLNIFNSYVPPQWKVWKEKNPKAWRALHDSPPPLVLKLLKHLIPLKEERQYLSAWMYSSIVDRSYVYLVLCGAGGVGKGRFELILKGLHGASNTSEGKRSTITEKFNGQLVGKTIIWFDELKYDLEMENELKGIQNDYLPIERKGVDTSDSKIYASMAISNNKPRDNFIAFDARKFAPLVVGNSNLNLVMTDDEIDTLSKKVDPEDPGFDVVFVAQIAKWILRYGEKHAKKYRKLEYRGPMFWHLAHTSMSRWQKKAINEIVSKSALATAAWDRNEKAYLWSAIESRYLKRSGDKSITFPDFSTVKVFFDIFRDGNGKKTFKTQLLPGKNILGDFWIYPLVAEDKVIVLTEGSVSQQREKGKQKHEKEIIDL